MLKILIAGRLGRDAQHKQTQGGTDLCSVERLREVLVTDQDGQLRWRPRKNLTKRLWGARAFATVTSGGYHSGVIDQRRYYEHRVVYALFHGQWPKGEIDHINGDKTDNRIENLRDVTPSENHRNAPLSTANTSGVVGVYLNRRLGKWAAQIKCGGQTRHLGTYETKDEAALARKRAEAELGFHPNHGRAA